MLNNHSETVNMDMSIFQSDKDFGGAFYRKNAKGRVQTKKGTTAMCNPL